MALIEEYGPTIAAAAVGAFIGVGLLGLALYYGDKKGIGFAENVRDGLGG